jgi:DNA-binding transcriptional LysR family regulator
MRGVVLLLEHLLTFARVVETGSVTLAAQEMGLSQPAVTKRLSRLETDLGQRLLERRSDRLVPTPAGELAYRHARRLADAVQALKADLVALSEPGRGELRLAAVDTMVLYTLPALLAEYRRREPLVAVHVRIGSIQETVELVLRGEADAGLTTVPIDDPRLVGHPLFWDPVIVAAVPELARTLPQPLGPMDLATMGLVTYAAGSRFRAYVDAVLAEHGVAVSPVMEFDSHEAVRVMATLGYGAALVPETVVREDLASGRLVRLELADLPPMGRTTTLLYRRDVELLPAPAHFAAMVRAHYAGAEPMAGS